MPFYFRIPLPGPFGYSVRLGGRKRRPASRAAKPRARNVLVTVTSSEPCPGDEAMLTVGVRDDYGHTDSITFEPEDFARDQITPGSRFRIHLNRNGAVTAMRPAQ
ncbi:MAG: hypothetical protein ACRDNZ_23240 [Streptosporangiaceae bacterium]